MRKGTAAFRMPEFDEMQQRVHPQAGNVRISLQVG
jgi:hypothetical protein